MLTSPTPDPEPGPTGDPGRQPWGLVLLAHGSPDPRHAADIRVLAAGVQALVPRVPIEIAYLDHLEPSPAAVGVRFASHRGTLVVVPVLMARAFHARVDVPAALDAIRASASACAVLLAQPLGPHPLLGEALLELLPDPKGVDVPEGTDSPEWRVGADGVEVPQGASDRAAPSDESNAAENVLVLLAGSSDGLAVDDLIATIRSASSRLAAAEFASLADQLELDAVLDRMRERPGRPRVVSAVIADGILRDRMAAQCAQRGLPLVAGTLAGTQSLAALAIIRARESLSARSG